VKNVPLCKSHLKPLPGLSFTARRAYIFESLNKIYGELRPYTEFMTEEKSIVVRKLRVAVVYIYST